ncbi:hypothetical protein ACI2KS_23860 [Pseudomonas sp. NPDC087358]|uniref:hypothetical protein n=1 Tax=Pseudomonas sp. NPDC087358 TaxID=3364439 RepID=UPI00384F2E69
MNNVTAALPRRSMMQVEQRFLRIAGEELAKVQLGGAVAMANLLDIVASWHGSRAQVGFHEFGRQWIQEGGATSRAADKLLRDLFGLNNEPDPRKAA